MLTLKQEKFCNLYIELGNASDAYRGAYSCVNMKLESIHRKACELLSNVKVSARVKELQDQLQKRSDISKDEAVSVLAAIVRVNPLDYIDISTNTSVKSELKETKFETEQIIIVKNLSELSVEQQKCIKSISPTKFGLKIEFESKISAIDRLAKMLDWDSSIKTDISISEKEVRINDWITKNAK